MLHADAITNERVRILFAKAPASITSAVFATVLMALLFMGEIPLSVLLLWVGFMFLINMVRGWIIVDYKKHKDNIPNHSSFEKRYFLITCLVGGSWAFIIFMGLNLPDTEYRVYSLLLLVGIISISIPAFSSSIKTLYFYTAPSLIISIPLLLMRGGDDTLLGLCLIVYSVMALRSGKDFYNTLIDSFAARFQAQEMAENMKQLHHDKSETEQRLLLHREQSPVGIIEWNTDFEFLEWNPAAEKIFGFTEEEVQGQHITERILPESARPAVNKIWADLLANKGGFYSLNENITKDGRFIMCEWRNTPLVDKDGNVIGVTSLVDDVTKRQRDEENLRHSQKMDAIGKLTGGIAHDFNNLLGIILGYAELLDIKLKDQTSLKEYTHQIRQAGKRGAKLTKKLLAFSSKEISEANSININDLLLDEQDMLNKTLTARIELVFDLDETLWMVWLNGCDLEDAILNLCINATYAIETSGQIIIQTKNIKLDEVVAQQLDLRSGDYVLLSVTDTGSGMDEITKEKIFEPFYSTKGKEGTGLGLSQVYGFVERSTAAIKVNSEPNHGSEFLLYFPRYFGEDKNKITKENSSNHIGGNETILVVDDEPALLKFLSELLSEKGYNVLCAERADQALKIMEKESIDLMISDVIMPEMDGYQLASITQEKHPNIKIQMVSGFTDDSQLAIKDKSLHENLLHKPYQAQLVFKRIRSLLDKS